jgi:hypothetical protein
VGRSRNLGLEQKPPALADLVLAVQLLCLRNDARRLESVSIITAIAGGVLALTGLYTFFHKAGARPTSFGT